MPAIGGPPSATRGDQISVDKKSRTATASIATPSRPVDVPSLRLPRVTRRLVWLLGGDAHPLANRAGAVTRAGPISGTTGGAAPSSSSHSRPGWAQLQRLPPQREPPPEQPGTIRQMPLTASDRCLRPPAAVGL